jgi:uncharacterized protein (TIRG00374 family)
LRTIRICLGMALAGLFLVLLFRQVPVGDAARALTKVGPGTLAFGCGLILAAYLLRVRRWQLILRAAGTDVSYRAAAPVFFAAFALNNLLPLRAGDIYRWMATPGAGGATKSRAFAALAVERVLDLAALAAILAALLVAAPPASIERANGALLVLIVLVVIAIAAMLVAPGAMQAALRRRRFADMRRPLIRSVLDVVSSTAEAVESIVRGRLMLHAGALTLLAWGLELMVFVAMAFAFDGTARVLGGLYGGLLGTLATLLPGAPGHVGTFDYFAALGFRSGGLDTASAVAAALAAHLVVVVPVTAIGAIGLFAARARIRAC